MSTLSERLRIAGLIEIGNDPKVGYYYSSCVIFGEPGRICSDPLGYALIGFLGNPETALAQYSELVKSLRPSNPACVRGAYALAKILGEDPFLILDIWERCGMYHGITTQRSEAVADFVRQLRQEREIPKGTFTQEMLAYLERIKQAA